MPKSVYTPTVWEDGADGGTPINAARLNNIEHGIGAALPAIGDAICSKTEFNPAEKYGGSWVYLDTHMFLGWHVYERTA